MPAVFVLPASVDGQQGPVASLLSTAGWASAADRVVGTSWIVTPEGVVDPTHARLRGTDTGLTSEGIAGWRRQVPTTMKTLAKDVRQFIRSRRFSIDPDGPWNRSDLDFVWQRHELFDTTGLDLARRLARPSVLFVPATKVWEAQQWGVERPGWGRLLERLGEAPALTSADLVACGSEEVAAEARRIGTPSERILITPTGVDLDCFDSVPGDEARRASIRDRLGLGSDFVVGWVGSFRAFHAVDQLVESVAGLEGVHLLLVGDGPERQRISALVAERGVSATFTGTVSHLDLPDYLTAMDAAVVLSPPSGQFHYSPLKLAEYLASRLPVVAPAVGPLARRLTSNVDSLLVRPGDVAGIRRALVLLRDHPQERERLGAAARVAAESEWSWDSQVKRIVAALGETQRQAPT